MPAKNPISYKLVFSILIVFWCGTGLFAQNVSKTNYLLHINLIDKDSTFDVQQFKLQSSFNSEQAALSYINNIPKLLASKGYPIASLDSAWRVNDTFFLDIYLGNNYTLVSLKSGNIPAKALSEAGFSERDVLNRPINISQLQILQARLLDYYERTGYPFASVYLDSIEVQSNMISASLKADPSVLYHIDSIRVYGKARIRNKFLQQYLRINNGSVYNKSTLSEVDKRISELPYLVSEQPSDLLMLGRGSVLNLYLATRRSSQINFLVGFLPAANKTGKLQLTGDVNLDLKNLLGGGESILVKWQQLQLQSPRLNLGFNQPYIFNSPFGIDFLFDLFKKDSSFLQLNAQIGAQYAFSMTQAGKLFVQFQNTSLLSGGVDTFAVKSQKKLPDNIDVNSVNVGIQYEYVKTNYRLNPIKGNELFLLTSLGVKKVKQNNEITSIKDPAFNYASLYDSIKPQSYQFRLRATAAHYFPMGKYATLKTSLTTGLFMSPDIFRNELFQIGGYKLLRGFDEESIYANRFAIASAEYRVLMSLNSYIYLFADAGLVKNNYQNINLKNSFIGSGLGLLYETKLGLLNISFAIGKRDDVKFNLRESTKLHFGYINYF